MALVPGEEWGLICDEVGETIAGCDRAGTEVGATTALGCMVDTEVSASIAAGAAVGILVTIGEGGGMPDTDS